MLLAPVLMVQEYNTIRYKNLILCKRQLLQDKQHFYEDEQQKNCKKVFFKGGRGISR